jgi:S-disulfanyl-L-cysteine oxidoreductase SoxD
VAKVHCVILALLGVEVLYAAARPLSSRPSLQMSSRPFCCALAQQKAEGSAFVSPAPHQGNETSRSVWDGVYTDEQAKRGEALYTKECAACHGDTLIGGGGASPLTGGTFLSNWNGLTVGDLYERIRKTMPQGSIGKLTRQQDADVLAYVLSFNKFPAGKTELQKQPEFLKQIRFEATKPEANKKPDSRN